ERAAAPRDVRAEILRVAGRALALVRLIHQLNAEAAHERRRPILDDVLVATVEVAVIVHRRLEAADRHVAERIDVTRRHLERRIPTAHGDRAPGALEADGAVARGKGRVVRIRTERCLELEDGLEAAAEVLGTANAKPRGLVFNARAALGRVVLR